MRYEDWDLLIFPQDSKVPLQEFKTQCHVVHDPGKIANRVVEHALEPTIT